MDVADERLLDPRNRRRLAVVVLSILGHVLALTLLVWRPTEPDPIIDAEPMIVALVKPPPKPPTPPAPVPSPIPTPPAAAKPLPHQAKVRPAKLPPPPDVAPIPASKQLAPENLAGELSDGEMASASVAGAGGGGGGTCDVALWLQNGLRKDARVQAAIARASEAAEGPRRAVRVWNGDWLRNVNEDGSGLAVIREAIMFEILSAPAACRAQPMRGLVVISPSSRPGSPRLAMGAGEWRWGDLLHARGVVRR